MSEKPLMTHVNRSRAAAYVRDRGASFDEFEKMLEAGHRKEYDVLIVDDWWILGEDKETLVSNIQRIRKAGIHLEIVAEEDGRAPEICPACDRRPEISTRGFEAARHRANMHGSLGKERGDMLAYAWCVSGVLVGPVESRPAHLCQCDVQRWDEACERYEEEDAEALWLELGVTASLMKKAEDGIKKGNRSVQPEFTDAIDKHIHALNAPLGIKTAQQWDEELLVNAKTLWDESFGRGGGEVEMFDIIMGGFADQGLIDPADLPGESVRNYPGKLALKALELHAQGLWAECGYPTLTSSHTFTAALACTHVSAENADDIETPWTTFMVHLPSDMFVHPHSGDVIDRVLVSQHSARRRCATISICSRTSGGKSLTVGTKYGGNLSELLFSDQTIEEAIDPTSIRLWRTITRVCVGLLYTLQHTNNWKSKYPVVDSKRSFEKGPPKHRVVIVGRPLAYDARPGLMQYLRGDRPGRAPPSVQSLVTGHYKRQVIGIGRFGRKVIWIEPYWRGPKNAPILMRPKKVGN